MSLKNFFLNHSIFERRILKLLTILILLNIFKRILQESYDYSGILHASVSVPSLALKCIVLSLVYLILNSFGGCFQLLVDFPSTIFNMLL